MHRASGSCSEKSVRGLEVDLATAMHSCLGLVLRQLSAKSVEDFLSG